MLHVLYLVHDVSDPAVRRRVKMLRAGGARITLAGFRRTPSPIADIDGLVPVDVIQKLLKERPAIAGIALPGMPMGAPGMGGSKTGPFTIYAVSKDGSAPKVYAVE